MKFCETRFGRFCIGLLVTLWLVVMIGSLGIAMNCECSITGDDIFANPMILITHHAPLSVGLFLIMFMVTLWVLVE